MARKARKIFETRYFGLIIGVLVFLLLLALTYQTRLVDIVELGFLDFNFRLKNVIGRTRVQEGVTLEKKNPNISPDLLIVGIDDRSLERFGQWPFPRHTHANLINAFSRIKDQDQRERALFLDIFFVEPSKAAEDDAMLVESIRRNGRIFLEPILTRAENTPGTEEEFYGRQDILGERFGTITNIQGDWTQVETMYGVYPPLKPYARATFGYGHPNFVEDDDQVYRRQPLVLKLARFIEEIPLDELTPESLLPEERDAFVRLSWIDTDNLPHDVPYPLTPQVIAELREVMARRAPLKKVESEKEGEEPLEFHVVRKYQDVLLPSITLSLATHYFHKQLSDLEVVLGRHIRIPAPQRFNPENGSLEPYRIAEAGGERVLDEILIPINERGQMLINFMGIGSSPSPQGHQTFPVRPFSGYASASTGADPAAWPETRAVGNKILMVGPFASGIAEDEKTTPFGLMYGVEIHANALNTILMNRFLTYVPVWVNVAILAVFTLLAAFMAARLSTLWSLVISGVVGIVYFFSVMLVFDLYSRILILSSPLAGLILSLLAVIAYRVMTEEKDKRHILSMFGKYVSPAVVAQLQVNPPELGGVDKDLTVFFSDIRGFTTLSESMTPQELVNHLNLYLTAMTDIILEYQGTLDKYVGDEIMCFWGAPLPQDEHAILACKCALRQMEVLRQLNAGWPPEKRINIGIGVNSGIMTVGNMGSQGRMNYTLMGDNVNLGARLEGTNKQYGTEIIISENTYGLVKGRVEARELDNIRVKGKNRPVVIYELIDIPEGLEPPRLAETRKQKVEV